MLVRRSRMVLFTVPIVLVFFVLAGTASASHWYNDGWRDKHWDYPARPNGETALRSTFGAPCNSSAYYNHNIRWSGVLPDGTVRAYTIVYHKKLGGKGVSGWIAGTGGTSTAFDNDVHGHIGNAHLFPYIRGGIGAYNCRVISGTSTYSTHSWGVALDINWSWEHYKHCHNHTINSSVAAYLEQHGWYWGAHFSPNCDYMHFQYVTGR